MKIGILGGTFDPVHMCHLIVAEQAREHLSLDEVWFIPSQIPPHKEEACISGTHRLRMLERAVENNPFFFAKDIELRREGRPIRSIR